MHKTQLGRMKRVRDEEALVRSSPRLAASAAAGAMPPPMSLDPIPEAGAKAKKVKKAEKRKLSNGEPSEKKRAREEEDVSDAKKAKKAAKAAKAAKEEEVGATDAVSEKKRKKAEKAAAKEAKAAAKEAADAGPAKRISPRLHASAGGAVPELSLGAPASAAPAILTADGYRKEHSITANTTLPDPVQAFATSPFDNRLKAAMAAAGYKQPSPIQAQAWPVAIGGSDLVAIAKTGSGKTVGFLLPAFSAALPKLPLKQGQGPLAIVMAPVRELAMQIQVEAERFGGAVGIKSVCVYGGAPKGPQIGALSRGRPVVVVGTPGRLNDLLSLANPPVFNLQSCTCTRHCLKPLHTPARPYAL